MSNNLIKQRADAQFRKLPGVKDGDGAKNRAHNSAQSEYEAAADARTVKIARLKGLRLARDAAELAAPPAVPVKKAGKNKKQKIQKLRTKQDKGPALSLFDWMKSRQVGVGS
jgi:hypothetical protein